MQVHCTQYWKNTAWQCKKEVSHAGTISDRTLFADSGIGEDGKFVYLVFCTGGNARAAGTVLESELQARGISLVVLRVQNQKALMYVCRKQRLQERLDDQEVQNFLGKYGYVQKDADYALQRLKERLAKAEGFPHEIGVFLDYPLEDVVGFIENAGQNYKCSGCWKVYCNECETRKLFAKYKKCREVYRRLWKQGRDIRTLTVAS